eukprot:6858-Heterococcus_DN1.PRE.1
MAGFWEKLGCNIRGRVSHNERWAPHASTVWNVLSGITSLYRTLGNYTLWIAVMQKGGALVGKLAHTVDWFQNKMQLKSQ